MKSNKMTEAEYFKACNDDAGICTECGEFAYGVEPDADGYECICCGADSVIGIENALISGNIFIV